MTDVKDDLPDHILALLGRGSWTASVATSTP